MSQDIEQYIVRLRAALAGADAATVHDAVSDAEEHLLIALQQVHLDNPGIDDADAWRRVVEDYGSPEDTAAAYLDLERRTVPSLGRAPRAGELNPLQRFFHVLGDPRAYAALFFMLISAVTGMVYFTWAVTGISLSLGLAALIIGLPFFGLFVFSIQGLALVEGRLVETLLGVRMPRRSAAGPRATGVWNRFKARLTDPRTWTTLFYLILKLPIGVLTFVVFTVFLVYALQLIMLPVFQYALDRPYVITSEFEFYAPLWLVPVLMFAGFLDLVVVLHAARWIGRGLGAMAKGMLVRP